MPEQRPNPKELLKYIEKEARIQAKGKLKIFLGAAPGVGKTYAMLEEALVKKNNGLDVVAGIVETHGRKETEAFLNKLEVIPRRSISYRGKELQEFDLDAAQARKPSLILVDEMAHANVPGSRHNKRWQDILELLDRGIDVYTTLNVQHIESLNNIITQITGVVVRETVPDTLLERANTIELIDLPAEDLIKRLEDGKVYIPEDVSTAMTHFFRKGNLTALRELALRATAERVDVEVLLQRRGESIEKIWPVTERVLVCIGPDPNAPQLIRAAFRMAKSLHAKWIAISVETPKISGSESDHQHIVQNLRLVEELGGETVIVSGTDIVSEILKFAHERNVTKIVLGKKVKPRWQSFFSRSLPDELVRHSIDIDLYILRGSKGIQTIHKTAPKRVTTPWIAYAISVATVVICTIINYFFYDYLALSTLILIYLFGLIFVASRGYYKASVLGSILSVLLLDFLFIPPQFSFSIADPEDFITLFAMLLITQIIASLSFLTKKQVESSRTREQRISTMYLLTKQLATHRGVDKLLEIAVAHISDVFNSEVIILLPNEAEALVPVAGNRADIRLNQKDQSVAQWVYDLGQPAGLGTETLLDNEAVYVPLLGNKGAIGVMRILPKIPDRLLIPEQLHLLEGFSNQIAMALEVDRLQEKAQKTELEIETDHVRSVLLKYISDNMRAPLLDIMGAANGVIEIGEELSSASIRNLGVGIYNNSEELNHLINNIAQITRLEATEMTLKKGLHSLYKVVNSALKSLNRKLADRPIKVDVPETLPKISFNKVFLEQVFFNIIENAIKYTPAKTPIDIVAEMEPKRVVVSIEDAGPGLALDEINKIFEKFYRGQSIVNVKGMGLGLTICQRIIHIHGGEIWAENRSEGGAAFRFTLPFEL